MTAGDGAGQGQTEPRASPPGVSGPSAGEEEADLVRVEARAVVPHTDDEMIGRPDERDLDPEARDRALDGVVDEVLEKDPERAPIPLDMEHSRRRGLERHRDGCRAVVVDREGERTAPNGKGPPRIPENVGHERDELDALRQVGTPLEVDSRGLEEGVDTELEPVGLVQDRVEEHAPLVRLQPRVGERLRSGADGAERRPEVVGGAGKEGVLGLPAALGVPKLEEEEAEDDEHSGERDRPEHEEPRDRPIVTGRKGQDPADEQRDDGEDADECHGQPDPPTPEPGAAYPRVRKVDRDPAGAERHRADRAGVGLARQTLCRALSHGPGRFLVAMRACWRIFRAPRPVHGRATTDEETTMSGTRPRTLTGRTALITGASGGIGAEIARDLAARGARVVLTARSKDKLDTLAEELAGAHGVEAVVIPSDLGTDAGVERLIGEISAAGLQIDILVNNAGLGAWGPFDTMGWESAAHLIDLDVKALVRLTAHFVPEMKARGAGHIMNISSFMAFVSCPNFALYGAAKAFVRNFTEALDVELRGTGVRAIAVCPGGTRTGFSAAAGQELNSLGERSLMRAEAVAKKSVRKMLRGRRTYIPGMINVVTRYALAIVPRTFRPALMGRIMAAGVKRRDAGR